MVLGNQVEWSLHVVVILALLPEGSRVSTKDMAEFHDVPKEYLSKAIQALSKAGVISTKLGNSGGIALAKLADEISVLDVVEAVEGRESSFVCEEIRKRGPCRVAMKEYSPVCDIAKTMYKADAAWRAVLRARTIGETAREVAKRASPVVAAKSEKWLKDRIILPKEGLSK